MLVRAPYTYSATIRRPRKRSDEQVFYRGHLDVEVAEVGEEDAPVVLHGVPDSFRDLPPHRSHDGVLWKPYGSTPRGGPGEAALRDRLVADPRGGRSEEDHPLHRSDGYGHRVSDAIPFDQDPLVKEVLASAHDEVVAKVREAARDLLLIGDGMWRRAEEPVYEIHRSISGDWVTIGTFSGDGDQYRLDQGHWIGEVEGPRRGRGDDFEPPEVVLLRPDLLRARTTEHSVARVGRQVVDALGEKLKEGTIEDLTSYVAVRDAVRTFARELGRGGSPDMPGLVAFLEEGVETLSRLDDTGVEYERRRVARAVVRVGLETGSSHEPALAGSIM